MSLPPNRMGTVFLWAFILWVLSCLVGCAVGPKPLKGGVAKISGVLLSPVRAVSSALGGTGPDKAQDAGGNAETPPGAAESPGMTLQQPDNPAAPASQGFERSNEDELTFSTDSVIVETVTSPTGQTIRRIEVPAGSVLGKRESSKGGQVIGASQKDTARADTAWLASFQKVQGVGVVVFLAGILGFAWAPARALVGKDTAVVVGCSGLVLIFGPAILQKYGTYFIGVLFLAAAYWFISRSKLKEGRLEVLETQTPKTGLK